MNQVLLVIVFCSLQISVSPTFRIRYNNAFDIIFSNQNFTKFRDCLCHPHLNPTDVNTNIPNQKNVAYVFNIECESNTDVKQTSTKLDCKIFQAKTASTPTEFIINCKPSMSGKVSDGVTKNDSLMCPNGCLTIQWYTDDSIDLFYDDQVSNTCETTLVSTTSTVSRSTTTTSIPHVSYFLNSSSSREETNDGPLLSELQIVFVVSLVLLCFAVSFIIGAKRASLMKFCKGQKQRCFNKINYVGQNTMTITTEHAALHEEDVKNIINTNIECIPLFDIRKNASRVGTTTYPDNISADSHPHGTEELVRSRDVNSFLDHIYADLDDTVAGANSNHYDDGYSERQSVIVELPIRNKIILNGNNKQGYYEVEREDEQHGIVQGLTEECFHDGAILKVSEDGYEVPRYKTYNLCLENKNENDNLKYTLFGRRSFEKNVKLNEPSSKLAYFEKQSVIIDLPIRNKIILNGNSKQGYYEVEREDEQHGIVQGLTVECFHDGANVNVSEDGYEVPRYKTLNLGLENKNKKDTLKYTLFGRRSFEKNVKLNEPSSKLAYFELEVNDLVGDVSTHQHGFPTRGTECDTAMSGDGYEVPVQRTCNPIQEHELDNDNNLIKCVTDPQSISDTINQIPDNSCDGSFEANRQVSADMYSAASIECNSSAIVISQGDKHDVNETTKQRYYEVELDEGSNGYLQDAPEDCCISVIMLENISNNGNQLPHQKLTNDSCPARTIEIPLHSLYETIPNVESDS